MNMDSSSKRELVVDLAKIFVIAVSYHLLWAFKNSGPMLTENFLYEVSFLLAGVVLYHVVVSNFVKQYNAKQA
jgi:hypothetical protein